MIKVTNFTNETNLLDKGVYMIKHSSTDIMYVGSTAQEDGFRGRWRSHLNGLLRNKGNRVLLNIYHKYGIEGFSFHIIERLNENSIEEIRSREQYWIDYYDSYKHGANCTRETDSAFNNYDRLPNTPEKCKLYSRACTTKKPVYVYTKNGELIHTFESSVACDKYFGFKKGRTSDKISSNKSYKGEYFFSRELKEWNPLQEKKNRKLIAANLTAQTRKKNRSYIVTEEHRSKIRESNPTKKKVVLYTLDGKEYKTFQSLNECDDYLELTRGTTSKVLNGKGKTLKKLYIPKLAS